MDLAPDTLVLLSRIQFAFTISFHIVFPAFTIGLASFLAVLEGLWLKTKKPVYRNLYLFWVKIFALSFGMGVVSGITMSFQFGTNWPGFMETVGNIAGPLLAYEVMTDGQAGTGKDAVTTLEAFYADGKNDEFKIVAINTLGQKSFLYFEIYNRNGKLLTNKITDYKAGWNGRSLAGDMQDMGVYFVKLVKFNKDGIQVVETTPIYLLK